MIYASQFVREAFGVAPMGRPYQGEHTHCSMCGKPMKAGDLHETDKEAFGKSFNDRVHLSGSMVVCGDCVAVKSYLLFPRVQKGVITQDGLYPLSTDAARAWFWLTPPEPPYLLVFNSKDYANMHYWWRVPMTMDNRLVHFSFDGRLASVERARLLKALEQAKRLTDAMNEDAKAGAKKRAKVYESPFFSVTRDGVFKPKVASHANFLKEFWPVFEKRPDLEDAVRYLQGLSSAELFVLSAFLKKTPSAPEKPELVTATAPKPKAGRKKSDEDDDEND